MKRVPFKTEHNVIKAYKAGTRKKFNELEQRIIKAYKFRIRQPVKPLTKAEKVMTQLLHTEMIFHTDQHLKIENSLKDGRIYWTIVSFDRKFSGYDYFKCIMKCLKANEYMNEIDEAIENKGPFPAVKPQFYPGDYETALK